MEPWKRERLCFFCVLIVGEVKFCMRGLSPMRDPNHDMGLWFGSLLLEIALVVKDMHRRP